MKTIVLFILFTLSAIYALTDNQGVLHPEGIECSASMDSIEDGDYLSKIDYGLIVRNITSDPDQPIDEYISKSVANTFKICNTNIAYSIVYSIFEHPIRTIVSSMADYLPSSASPNHNIEFTYKTKPLETHIEIDQDIFLKNPVMSTFYDALRFIWFIIYILGVLYISYGSVAYLIKRGVGDEHTSDEFKKNVSENTSTNSSKIVIAVIGTAPFIGGYALIQALLLSIVITGIALSNIFYSFFVALMVNSANIPENNAQIGTDIEVTSVAVSSKSANILIKKQLNYQMCVNLYRNILASTPNTNNDAPPNYLNLNTKPCFTQKPKTPSNYIFDYTQNSDNLALYQHCPISSKVNTTKYFYNKCDTLLNKKYESTIKTESGIYANSSFYTVPHKLLKLRTEASSLALMNKLNANYTTPNQTITNLKNEAFITRFIKNNHPIFFTSSVNQKKYQAQFKKLYNDYFKLTMNHPAFIGYIRKTTMPMANKAKKSYCKSSLANFLYSNYLTLDRPNASLADFSHFTLGELDNPIYDNVCATVNADGLFIRDYTPSELDKELQLTFNNYDRQTTPTLSKSDKSNILKLERDILDIAFAFSMSYHKLLHSIEYSIKNVDFESNSNDKLSHNINKGFLASISLIFNLDEYFNIKPNHPLNFQGNIKSKSVVDFAHQLIQTNLSEMNFDKLKTIFKKSVDNVIFSQVFLRQGINELSHGLWKNNYLFGMPSQSDEFIFNTTLTTPHQQNFSLSSYEDSVSKLPYTHCIDDDKTISVDKNPAPYVITRCAKVKINSYLKVVEAIIILKATFATVKAMLNGIRKSTEFTSDKEDKNILSPLISRMAEHIINYDTFKKNLKTKLVPKKILNNIPQTVKVLSSSILESLKDAIKSFVISVLAIIFILAFLALLAPPLLFILGQIKGLLLWIGKTFVFFITWPIQLIRNTSSTYTSNDDIIRVSINQFLTPTMIVISLTLSLIIFAVSIVAYNVVYYEFMEFAYNTFLIHFASLRNVNDFLPTLTTFMGNATHDSSGALLWLISEYVLPVLIIGYLLVKSISVSESLIATVSKTIGIHHQKEQAASTASVAMIFDKFYGDINDSMQGYRKLDSFKDDLIYLHTKDVLDPNQRYKARLDEKQATDLLKHLKDERAFKDLITFEQVVRKILDSTDEDWSAFRAEMNAGMIATGGTDLAEYTNKYILANTDFAKLQAQDLPINPQILKIMIDDKAIIGTQVPSEVAKQNKAIEDLINRLS